MIKKKLIKILGLALVSATLVTIPGSTFESNAAANTSQDTVASEASTNSSQDTVASEDSASSSQDTVENENSVSSSQDTVENEDSAEKNGLVENEDNIEETADSKDETMKNGWIYSSDGNMYYYKDNEMVTGWFSESPTLTSYFHENGASAKGWTEIDGKTYYFLEGPMGTGYHLCRNTSIDGFYLDKDGVRQDNVQTGWIQDEYGNWRYYKYDGTMVTGLYNFDKDQGTCYFDENGISLSGWQIIDGKEYYFRPTKQGSFAVKNQVIYGKYINSFGWVDNSVAIEKKGWIQDEKGDWRYYESNGTMSIGLCTLAPAATYYFDENGVSLSGWQTINGKECYFKPAGQGYIMARNETIDGKKINSSGWVDDSATIVKAGWTQDENGDWRYYSYGGEMYKGFHTLAPECYYYFNPETGICASGWTEINGELYYFKPAYGNGYMMATNETIDGIYIDKLGHAQK